METSNPDDFFNDSFEGLSLDEHDSSIVSVDSTGGLSTNDLSVDHNTRSTTKDSRDRVQSWDGLRSWALKDDSSHSKAEEEMIFDILHPFFSVISSHPNIPKAIYASSPLESQIKTFIRDSKRFADELENIMAARPEVDYKVISFSKMNMKVLKAIGVVLHDTSKEFGSNFLDVFTSDSALDDESVFTERRTSFLKYWIPSDAALSGHSFMTKCLSLISLYMLHFLEAGSRTIIDAVFLGLAHLMRDMEYEQVIVPELKVSSNANALVQANHTIPTIDTNWEIKGKPVVVVLHGSIDYATTAKLVRELLSEYNLATLFSADREMNQFQIFMVEAKKPASTTGDGGTAFNQLSKHLPQVIGEAMAGIKYKEAQQARSQGVNKLFNAQSVPWCLSDGINWIFGILVYEPLQNDACKWHSYRLENITLGKDGVAGIHLGDLTALKRLMATLVILSTFQPQYIVDELDHIIVNRHCINTCNWLR
ncbi:hypothetical protein CVT24_007108 [Panaeolus cyanescens]|uniref:Uncharacterized protein n=1 Tax=Panaeolus cyanescens TaxID=181874 RepID=A0A409YP45_9AGAR|nr:hypothetical protein CVT24_007108 [Panaeolus cyanescens]